MINTFKLYTHRDFTAWQEEKKQLLTKCEEAETAFKNLQDMSKDMTETQAEHNNVIAKLKADHETALTQLKADYEKQISDLNNKITAEATNTETKAANLIASLGIPQDELPKVALNDNNNINILEKMKALSASELSEQFMKNQKAVFAALKAKAAKKDK